MPSRQHSKSSSDVTIMDVAREAGVSYATVSRVVNNKGYIRSDTRERVLQAITRLGYVVNQQARSLAGGRSQVIGLLVQDLSTGYIGEIIRGIDIGLAEAHYDLMLYTTHRRKTRESAYVTTLTQGMADGLLLVLPRNAEAYLETLDRRGFPYVLIDHRAIGEGRAAVGAANYQGSQAATRYLIELGHRRIGFVTGTMIVPAAGERLAGYQAALAECGLAADPALVCDGDFSQPSGYTAAQALLGLALPPTAIFASNDDMAFGVMEAVREAGLRIPADMSVVGFDDIPRASYVRPPLTTVRQPLEEMGRAATRLLLEQINGAAAAGAPLVLPTTLVVRGSCQEPPASAR